MKDTGYVARGLLRRPVKVVVVARRAIHWTDFVGFDVIHKKRVELVVREQHGGRTWVIDEDDLFRSKESA